MKIGKNPFFSSFLAIFLFLLLLASAVGYEIAEYALVYSILLNCLIIHRIRNRPPLVILFLFLLVFLFYLIPFIFFDIKISDYLNYQNTEIFEKLLAIHAVFLLSFLFFTHDVSNEIYIPIRDRINVINVPIIFISLYIISFFSIVFFFQGDIVYFKENSYSVYTANLSKETGLPEYLIIFFVLMFFTAVTKLQKRLLILLIIIYAVKLFLLGYRVQFMMACMILYLFYIDGFLKVSHIVLLSVLGFIFFSLFGYLKEGETNLSLLLMFFDLRYDFVLSHQTGVLYSSAAFIGLTHSNIIDFHERLASFAGFLMNMIVPSRFVADLLPEGLLAKFVQSYTRTAGGGLVSIQFYVWIGIFGVVFLGWWLSQVFNKVFSKKSNKLSDEIIYLYAFTILITFPRWISYDPGNFLFRMPFYVIIIYALLRYISHFSAKRSLL